MAITQCIRLFTHDKRLISCEGIANEPCHVKGEMANERRHVRAPSPACLVGIQTLVLPRALLFPISLKSSHIFQLELCSKYRGPQIDVCLSVCFSAQNRISAWILSKLSCDLSMSASLLKSAYMSLFKIFL